MIWAQLLNTGEKAWSMEKLSLTITEKKSGRFLVKISGTKQKTCLLPILISITSFLIRASAD
jgi:hypothetical protein